MEFINDFSEILFASCRDVLPIIILITGFQLLVLRQPIPHLSEPWYCCAEPTAQQLQGF